MITGVQDKIERKDLYEFGEWAHDRHQAPMCKSAWSAVERGNVAQAGSKFVYELTDDKADAIDKAICQLTNYDADLSKVFVQHYLLDYSERELAVKHNCGRSTINKQINLASGFVLGAANNLANKRLTGRPV